MGTQKNRLNETVLLSTQHIGLKVWVRKYLHFYAEKFCLSKPMGPDSMPSLFVMSPLLEFLTPYPMIILVLLDHTGWAVIANTLVYVINMFPLAKNNVFDHQCGNHGTQL